MKSNFQPSLDLVLKSEGLWSDHPNDPGGATMCGITIGVYSQWMCRPVTKDELRRITSAEIAEIYRHNYWDVCRCDDLPTPIDYLVFDFGVNAGVGRSAKTLQSCVGVAADGSIGPITLGVVGSFKPERLITLFSEAKRRFYRSLTTFNVFGAGWLNRVAEVEKNAQAMLTAVAKEAT